MGTTPPALLLAVGRDRAVVWLLGQSCRSRSGVFCLCGAVRVIHDDTCTPRSCIYICIYIYTLGVQDHFKDGP